MSQLRAWLQGKKTYICAAALAVIGCAGYFAGALDGATASAVLCAAGGVAGLGAKWQRAADSILVALNNVRDAQALAAAQHKPVDVKQLAAAVAKEIAPQVVSAIVPAKEAQR
ncbi:MAG TPA: hypothetical protein VF532_25005 [Candidatus Angelobacter sp.]